MASRSSNYEYPHNSITFPVVNQPGVYQPQNYPRGLEMLNDMSTIVVSEVAPPFCSCENDKIYKILYQGTKIFTVREEGSDCWTHCCYGTRRPFKFVLYDADENGLMSVFRESVRLQNFVQVKIAGRIVGSVQNHQTFCKPKMSIRNASGELLFKIKRSICLPLCFLSEIDFFIFDLNGEEVGKITRHWRGSCSQVCAWADTFSIKFPSDADIISKALLIGACFLIDFTHFEPKQGGCGAVATTTT